MDINHILASYWQALKISNETAVDKLYYPIRIFIFIRGFKVQNLNEGR